MHLKFIHKFHFMVYLPPQLAKEWWKTAKYYSSLPSSYTSKEEKLVIKLYAKDFRAHKMRIK